MKGIIRILLLVVFVVSCNESNYLGNDIRLFKGEVWELAKAVEKEDVKEIKRIAREKKIFIDYQEKKYGKTLLIWSVMTNKFESTKALLELGANPKIQDNNEKTSAFMYAAGKYETSKYVKLILKFGWDPNSVSERCLAYRCTPLIAAASQRLESVKLLIDSGADFNYTTYSGKTALSTSLMSCKIDIAHYLILEKGANFVNPVGETIDKKPYYCVNLLRRCHFSLDSNEYFIKMKIVNYMLKHGVNYWETPIPKHYYNNYDSAYLEKY